MKTQWMQCTCGKKVNPNIDSPLWRGEVGHYVPKSKSSDNRCNGKLTACGPIVEVK